MRKVIHWELYKKLKLFPLLLVLLPLIIVALYPNLPLPYMSTKLNLRK